MKIIENVLPGRNLLTQWVSSKHEGQLIRHSNSPYFVHLLAVAEMAAPCTPLGYEMGFCHDLLEKTSSSATELNKSLLRFGYSENQAEYITGVVVELTDVYTKSAYPHLSKVERKAKEAERLATCSAAAQTVKYADLAYNIQWVLQYDKEHLTSYLARKQLLLLSMSTGNADLRRQVLQTISRLLNG